MIALLLCLFVWPTLGLGQTRAGVFRVSNIPVDVTSSDAVSARRDALAQGQREGLERLMRRLVPADRYGQLPAAANLPMERYVQSFEIANEEVSNTRYLAELTVGYDAEAVRELLAKQGLPFAEMRSAPLLVLPLYEAPDGPVLWPENNPWWQAWADNLDPERLLRLVLPLGDLGDMALVNVGQVQAGDEAALLALAERYDSKDVLVVTATPVPGAGPNGAPSVQLQTRRVGEVMQVNPPEVVAGQPGQIEEELLAEAVRRLQNSLDEQWKAANLLRYDQAGSMVVDVPISTLADWVGIHQGLQGLPEISEVTVTSFARDEVRAQIRYIGDEVRLGQALARLGLALSQEGDSWLLQPTGQNPSLGGPPNATSTAS